MKIKECYIKSFKAKKKFGQNFLKDEFYLKQIVESVSSLKAMLEAESSIEMRVVEVGPGLGDLSVKLLNYFDLIAYEIDNELCSYLQDRFPKKVFDLHNKDVLSLPFKNGWLYHREYVLVSNLPYNIATRVILNALQDTMCRGMVVMTQKEVAEKFCAQFGESDFCAISILAQSVSENITKIALVPPNAFSPIPKVDSTIFSICKTKGKIEYEFGDFLKKAFCSPRKKVIKNLSHIQNLEEIFHQLNISSNARAHQIDTFQYHQIFNATKEIKWKKITKKE